MEFYDALKLLAGRAGVELKPRRSIHYGEKEYQPSEKTKLFEINNLAARLYHKILTDHPKTQHARKYLVNRGLKKESIVNFQLGYAPRSWDLLLRFLK
ncbi:DNA primase, partial [Candidatus Berkelbacteria bacterium CG11_big_fil_rev_8_21_14_0_20_42_15]